MVLGVGCMVWGLGCGRLEREEAVVGARCPSGSMNEDHPRAFVEAESVRSWLWEWK